MLFSGEMACNAGKFNWMPQLLPLLHSHVYAAPSTPALLLLPHLDYTLTMLLRGEAAQDGEPSSDVDNIRLMNKIVRGQALGLALLHANPLSKGLRKYGLFPYNR